MDEMIGRRIDRYVIRAFLGRGGMGEVYLAEHERLKTRYAIKFLSPDLASARGFVERFHTEARLMAELDHPHICKVVNMGEDAGRYFLVMEYVGDEDGRVVGEEQIRSRISESISKSLGEGTTRDGPPPPDDYPSPFQGEGRVRVEGAPDSLDFESTERPRYRKTSSGALLGTYDYMSPEQRAGGTAEHTIDIYALGVIIYRLLTGRRPEGRFPLPSAVVAGLGKTWDAVVGRCLGTDPDDRFQSAGEVETALATRPARRTLRYVAGLAALIVVAVGIWFAVQESTQRPEAPSPQPPKPAPPQPMPPTPVPKPPPVVTPVPKVTLQDAVEAKGRMAGARKEAEAAPPDGVFTKLRADAEQKETEAEEYLKKEGSSPESEPGLGW